MFCFPGSCHDNFCSDSSELSLIQIMSPLAICESCTVKLTIHASGRAELLHCQLLIRLSTSCP